MQTTISGARDCGAVSKVGATGGSGNGSGWDSECSSREGCYSSEDPRDCQIRYRVRNENALKSYMEKRDMMGIEDVDLFGW